MKGFIVVLLVGVFENGTNITALIADIPFYVIYNFVFNKDCTEYLRTLDLGTKR